MHLIMQTSEALAMDLRHSTHDEAGALLRVIKELNVSIKPMRERVEGTPLDTYFIVELLNDTSPAQVIERLNRISGVKAYSKPPDELP